MLHKAMVNFQKNYPSKKCFFNHMSWCDLHIVTFHITMCLDMSIKLYEFLLIFL